MARRHRRNYESVAIGRMAGEESSTEFTVSVGRKAGYTAQAEYAIAVGDNAAEETQGQYAIAIGSTAGKTTQSENAIAIGQQAGKTTQGANAIAIGGFAGVTNQYANSIIINAQTTPLNSLKAGLFINPIRQLATGSNILTYHKDSKEVSASFPELPGYATDALATADYIKANTVTVIPAPVPPLIPPTKPNNGTMYFDTTKKKVKYWNGTKWVIMLDELDYAKIKELLPALPAL